MPDAREPASGLANGVKNILEARIWILPERVVQVVQVRIAGPAIYIYI